jgi:hypothetical protein
MAMTKTDSEGNPIVTMDAVKKAGFTNLRDYLNDKRNLKRRDNKPVMRIPSDADIARAQSETAKAKAKAKAEFTAPVSMDDATSKAVTKNALEQAAIKGEQKPVTPASLTPVTKQVGRGGLNKGVTDKPNLASAPKPVAKGPSAEEKAAAAAAKTKKDKATRDAAAASKTVPKTRYGEAVEGMKHGGVVKGYGAARGGKVCKIR